MKDARRGRLTAAAACLAALFLGGAILLPEGLSLEGSGGSGRAVVPDLPWFLDWFLVAAAAAVFVGGAAVAIALGVRNDPSTPVRRKGPANVLILLVLACLLVSLYASSREPGSDAGSGGRGTAGSGAGEEPGDRGSSDALGLLVAAVAGLLIAGGSVAAWRFARAQIPPEVRAEAFETRLLEEIDASVRDLEDIEDPRAAVVACYGRLRRLAGWSGVDVRRSDTAGELLEELARRAPALSPSAARLVGLFQRARFSPHPIDESDRAEALAALAEVRARLAVPA